MVVLKIYNLWKAYRKGDTEVLALRNVDLDVGEGELLAVVGPSGSGRTTLVNIISCLDMATSGTIAFVGG